MTWQFCAKLSKKASAGRYDAVSDKRATFVTETNLKRSCQKTYANINVIKLEAENTHHRGKYHCMADLLFIMFGWTRALLVWPNPNQSNMRSNIPLW